MNLSKISKTNTMENQLVSAQSFDLSIIMNIKHVYI